MKVIVYILLCCSLAYTANTPCATTFLLDNSTILIEAVMESFRLQRLTSGATVHLRNNLIHVIDISVEKIRAGDLSMVKDLKYALERSALIRF